MRGQLFMKGALAGGVGATAVLAASTAIAGNGIGGVFNLGQTNTVNETTKLTGAKAAGAQLQVQNTSTSGAVTGLSITTPAGKPPITLSNSVLNPRLNAQYLGGMPASGVGRIAMASTENLTGGFPFSTLTTVAITAPARGFVRLEGRVFAWDNNAAAFCSDCELAVRIHDATTGTDSPRSFFIGGAGSHSSGIEVPVSWVFPVTSGAHSYTLDAGQVDFAGGPLSLYNPVLTAQFVPFGGTGSPASLGASTTETSRRPARIGR
jgi:hypothetical protein